MVSEKGVRKWQKQGHQPQFATTCSFVPCLINRIHSIWLQQRVQLVPCLQHLSEGSAIYQQCVLDQMSINLYIPFHHRQKDGRKEWTCLHMTCLQNGPDWPIITKDNIPCENMHICHAYVNIPLPRHAAWDLEMSWIMSVLCLYLLRNDTHFCWIIFSATIS